MIMCMLRQYRKKKHHQRTTNVGEYLQKICIKGREPDSYMFLC